MPESDALFAAYEEALRKLANGGKGLSFQQQGAAAEARYAQAYQALVRAGLAPQLRKKYRP